MPPSRRCLVISYGPVPTPEHSIVEGGGLRCWGLAQGLRDNGIDVTVAVHHSYPQTLASHEGIKLRSWDLNEGFAELLGGYEAVLVSYCMGDLSETVAASISDDTYLVLDLYVPIYLEIPARDSDNSEAEYHSYMAELPRWNRVLERGDHFICANPAQRDLYTGVLGAVGRMNPLTYRDHILDIVPFGVDDSFPESVTPALPRRDGDGFVLLWFGGLYPWFDIRSLFAAVEELSLDGVPVRLLLVGGRNPFVMHPDFTKHYEDAVAYCRDRKILDSLVQFEDWVEYDKRAAWYASADAVIFLNRPGAENAYSWRTRLMDYVWAGIPVLTNGGDALSELLIERGAAAQVDVEDREALAAAVASLSSDRARVDQLRRNMAAVKRDFSWTKVTEKLAVTIATAARPSDAGIRPVPPPEPLTTPPEPTSRAARVADKLLLVPRVARAHGAPAAREVARQQLKNVATRFPRPKRYVFLAHQLDNSGAPSVLIDMAREFATRVGPGNVRVLSFPPVSWENQGLLSAAGVALEVLDHPWANLGLRRDDFVLMNTVSIRPLYRDRILGLLEAGSLAHAYWYIHEDEPAFHFADDLRHRIKTLAARGRLTLLVPGQQASTNYSRYFKTDTGVRLFNYWFSMDAPYTRERSAEDFARLDFHLTGTPADSRKGHPSLMIAFERLLDRIDPHDPRYRDFTLHFIGMGDDFLSRQMLRLGPQILGHRFAYTRKLGRREVLQVMSKCNVALCYSVRECLPLNIHESMALGHVILRNDCSGVDEQLEDGGNGFLLDSGDIDQVASTLELVLDTKQTGGERLAAMSKRSQELVEGFAHLSYWRQLFGDDKPPGAQ